MSLLTLNHPKPSFRLVVNGLNLTPAINNRLINLSITEYSGYHADTFNLTLTDHDLKLALPPLGKKAEVWLAWHGDPLINKGVFTLDQLTYSGAPNTLAISGRSANLSGSLGNQKTRSFEDKTLGELVEQLAEEHQLTPAISEAYQGIRKGHLDQTAETDLSFLTRLAKQHGAIATVKNEHLLFIPAGQTQTTSGQALPALKLTPGRTANFSYTRNASSHQGVKARYNEKRGGTLKTVLVGDGDQAKELKSTFATEEAALAAATAELKRLQSGEASLQLTLAKADLQLMPEAPLKLVGFKQEIDTQNWVIDSLSHNLSPDSGLTTQINAKLKPLEES